MKAIVYTKYGSPNVLQLKEVAKPEPKNNQVLVRVRAASVNALDYRRFEISTMGRFMEERFLKTINKVLGADIAQVMRFSGYPRDPRVGSPSMRVLLKKSWP